MSDAEVRPNQQAETVPDFPRNDLGELIIGEDFTVMGLPFEADRTIREIRQEIDEFRIEDKHEIDLERDRIRLIFEAYNLYFDGNVSEGLDDATTREAELLIAGLRQPKGGRHEPEEIEIEIPAQLEKLLYDAIEKLTKIATNTAEAKLDIVQNDMLKYLLDQQELEDGFETDIESPLSWSQENWQQVASMTPKEQAYFASKKKQSNASKRGWANHANTMLHDSMLEQARDEAIARDEDPDKVRVEAPNYNYQEWQIIKPLAEQADRANSMLYASMLEEARIEAEAQGKNAGDVRVEKPNYTYEEWKAMEVIHAAIKERQSDAAKRGWATRMNAELPSGEEYTYKQWKDIEAFVKAEKGGAEVDQSLDVSAD